LKPPNGRESKGKRYLSTFWRLLICTNNSIGYGFKPMAERPANQFLQHNSKQIVRFSPGIRV
jgi:hypothetical protein